MTTATDLIKALKSLYRDCGDDEIISIGRWRGYRVRHAELPEFAADIRITAGEIRAMNDL